MTACSTSHGANSKPKRQFPTATEAIAFYDEYNKNGKSPPMNAYECNKCKCWHLGRPSADHCNSPQGISRRDHDVLAATGISHAPISGYVWGAVCALAGFGWGLLIGRVAND